MAKSIHVPFDIYTFFRDNRVIMTCNEVIFTTMLSQIMTYFQNQHGISETKPHNTDILITFTSKYLRYE